jgi:hypothetical protein
METKPYSITFEYNLINGQIRCQAFLESHNVIIVNGELIFDQFASRVPMNIQDALYQISQSGIIDAENYPEWMQRGFAAVDLSLATPAIEQMQADYQNAVDNPPQG